MQPMTWTGDVVVLGGGPAGLGAAIAAARGGADTLLIEAGPQLGGATTASLVNHMIKTAGCDGGIIREIWQKLCRLGAARETHGFHEIMWVNPYAYEMLAVEMLEQAGAAIRLHTSLRDVTSEPQGPASRVRELTLHTKSGPQRVAARVAVDATGDGDLAVRAGSPFEKGSPEDGQLQAVSLNFLLGNVEPGRFPDRERFLALSRQAIADGRIDLPGHVQQLPAHLVAPEGAMAGLRHVMLDMAMNVDGSDAASLSEGQLLCRKRIFQIWRFLREQVPGYERCELVKVAPRLGIRETRRILGAYVLNEDDVKAGRKFPDGITRGSFYMDLHDGQPKPPDRKQALSPPEGDWYEIPYRCLLPRNVAGLLVAGRCISSTRLANGSTRIQATCMNLGQAAGTAAAMAVKADVLPHELDGAALRQRLIDAGMDL